MARRSKGSTIRSKKDIQDKIKKEKFNSDIHLAKPVTAKNNKQREFLKAIVSKQVVVFNAPAGVGKSYLTMCMVTDWLISGVYDKVLISRPSIGMGKTLGLLPGDLDMKYTPYLLPLIEVIKNRYGGGFYESCLNNGIIEFMPLEYLRGRSIDQIVVLDEGQNTTPEEMYSIITRMGENGKLIIIGDPSQNDLKGGNGITWICDFIQNHPHLKKHIKIVTATSDDIVRSGLCKTMVKAREKDICRDLK